MVKLEEHDSEPSTPSHLQAEPIKTVRVNHCNVTLLGTAHVSKASADKVQELIATQKYDAVAVELCPSRHKAIVNPDAMAKMDLFQVIKNGQASMVAASLALGAFQQRMAEQLDIEPGAEMRVAIKDAQAAQLPVLLIDREIGTTLKRIYHNVPWWKRFTLFAGLIESVISKEKFSEADIEKLKEGDVLESSFSQFAENEKDLFSPLISERDDYMSARLIKECTENNYQHILVVVGAGHLSGMAERLETQSITNPDERIAQPDGQTHHNRNRSGSDGALQPQINAQCAGDEYQQHVDRPNAGVEQGGQAHLRIYGRHEFFHAGLSIGGFSLTSGKKLEGQDVGIAVNNTACHQRARIGLQRGDAF